MATPPQSSPEAPNEKRVSAERIDQIEDHLERVEEAQGLGSIEERLEDLENGNQENEGDDYISPGVEGEGEKAVRLALAGILNNEAVVNAIAGLTKTTGDALKEWSGLKTKEIEAHRRISLRMYYFGLAFSAFVLVFLGTLLWHDKISKELAGTLIGSLIGYWYGRHERDKS